EKRNGVAQDFVRDQLKRKHALSQAEQPAVPVECAHRLLDHTHAHAKLLDCTPVGVFYGQSLRFVHRSKSLQMDLAGDHEIVDHVAREPPVAAPPDGVQTATHTDERAQTAFALPDLFLPAPISTDAAANCR